MFDKRGVAGNGNRRRGRHRTMGKRRDEGKIREVASSNRAAPVWRVYRVVFSKCIRRTACGDDRRDGELIRFKLNRAYPEN